MNHFADVTRPRIRVNVCLKMGIKSDNESRRVVLTATRIPIDSLDLYVAEEVVSSSDCRTATEKVRIILHGYTNVSES